MNSLTTKLLFYNNKNIKLLFNRYYSNGNHYDIIIAGGGMVGTTLASAFGTNPKLNNKDILLLEGAKRKNYEVKPEYSNRVSAIAPGTKKLFESVGAWKHIEAVRYGNVKKMQVWDGLSDAMITFDKNDLTDTIAYIVENDLMIGAVMKVLEDVSNVNIVNEAKITGYKLPKEHEDVVEVKMDNGVVYTCNLLIGADGYGSKVRKAMDVQYVSWNYNQMGVVATLKFSEPTNNIVAWQRFLSTGPLAVLPLNDDHANLIWTTTPEHARKLIQIPLEDFIDEINSALWKQPPTNLLATNINKSLISVLNSFQLETTGMRQLPPNIASCDENSRAAFPLGFGHATNYISKCVAIIGDAAHRIHPLAGQGVNLGFGDVECLNKLVGDAVYNGQFVGSRIHLKEYETVRQRHNVPLMLGIDGIQKLYNTDFTPVVLLRSLGLQLTQAMKPAKDFFSNYATK